VRTIYGDEAKATELFGLVVVEAMAAGCAVVASNVASLPELVAEGKDGFLVPPNNPAALREKIVALLSDPGRSAEMGRAGREKVQRKFTWRATAERCLAAYQELGLSQPFVRLLRPLTFTYP
jgi:glycosyltransferase involved in cell wall biosynthesis